MFLELLYRLLHNLLKIRDIGLIYAFVLLNLGKESLTTKLTPRKRHPLTPQLKINKQANMNISPIIELLEAADLDNVSQVLMEGLEIEKMHYAATNDPDVQQRIIATQLFLSAITLYRVEKARNRE